MARGQWLAEQPYQKAAAVTPDNDTAIPITDAIYVGGTGALKVRMLSGDEVTFTGVPAGSCLRIQCDKVFATGTAATAIVALYL